MTEWTRRLIESPRFGEKWARHWLDLARFAESNGKDRDVVFPHAWRYRDYVIAAFNSDKPIDLFIREQIAGDLLPGAGDEQIIATAFLALGPKAFQERDQEKFSLDVVDEQIDVLSRSVLGLTAACARCHDHKFDPVRMSDYYALAGILLSSDTRYGPGPLYFNNHDKDTELPPIGGRAEELHPRVREWRTKILTLTEKVTGLRSAAYRIQRDISGTLRERGLKKIDEAPDLAAKEKKRLAMRAEADQLNEERIAMIEEPPEEMPGYTMAVLDSSDPPEDCAIRERGVHNNHGERVPRGKFTIPGIPAFSEVADDESGRLQLADWLASNDNPLTARVFVNRVWLHLFGRGLVGTPDNFGRTGEAPSHPELLDYLAVQFMEDGWSLKKLVHEIVQTRVWRLSSAGHPGNSSMDPANRFLWRSRLRRLEVEAFRDSVLFVSGRLDLSPMRGSLFQNVYAGKDYGEETNSSRVNFDKEIASDCHRSIYLPIARNRSPRFLSLFDFADPNAPTGARNTRTIPAQALYLMNSPFIEEQSKAAAERILNLPEAARGAAAWRMTTGRQAKREVAREIETVVLKWSSGRSEIEAWTDLMQMLFASAPFRYIE